MLSSLNTCDGWVLFLNSVTKSIRSLKNPSPFCFNSYPLSNFSKLWWKVYRLDHRGFTSSFSTIRQYGKMRAKFFYSTFNLNTAIKIKVIKKKKTCKVVCQTKWNACILAIYQRLVLEWREIQKNLRFCRELCNSLLPCSLVPEQHQVVRNQLKLLGCVWNFYIFHACSPGRM